MKAKPARQEDRIQAMLPQILAKRKANKERQAANLTRLDGSTNELSQEEKEELEKKLKALGYIQ